MQKAVQVSLLSTLNNFHTCFGVSIVDFAQVNICWGALCCVNVITQSLYQKFKGEKMLSQTEKNFGYSKMTSAMLISHFRGLLFVTFRKIKSNGESADSVLEFSTEIYIFIKHPKN